MKADIPGVNKDQVKVYQDGDVLSISAETKQVCKGSTAYFPIETSLLGLYQACDILFSICSFHTW